MTNNVNNNNNVLPSDHLWTIQDIQDIQNNQNTSSNSETKVALQIAGSTIGDYVGLKANNLFIGIPGLSWAINRLNARFSSVDSRDAHFLETIKNLRATLNSIFSEFNLDSTQDFESRIQAAKSEKEKINLYKVEIETQFKLLFQFMSISEQSDPKRSSSGEMPSTLSSTSTDLSLSSVLLECDEGDQHAHSVTPVSVSPTMDESDPEIDKLREELRVLFDILEAVCFNNFTRLEAKHWTKLEALLEESKAEQRIGVAPLDQETNTSNSVDLDAVERAA